LLFACTPDETIVPTPEKDVCTVKSITKTTQHPLYSPDGSKYILGNFHPDGELFLFNADIGMDNAEGQDQYTLNINTGEVTNLTNSPEIWDEHGVFSPNGKKILFMSSYPYRDEPDAYRTLSIKTEFMIMDIDGANLRQLTHFREPGHPEYHNGIASTGHWNKEGTQILAHSLEFPDYHHWIIEHEGNCGNQNGWSK